ncbi:MAG: hypothetical protein HYX72_11620 [Acidobacteria bacterium]|nr:hypothetical protein [Acidobacteriota bacterium]
MAMLVAYFDESGTKEAFPGLAVSGLVSSADDWIGFSREWGEVLKKHKLSYLHMKEFRPKFGNVALKTRILMDFVRVIEGNTYRNFSSVIINAEFGNALSTGNRQFWKMNPYTLAGRTVAGNVREFMQRDFPNSNLKLVYESGVSEAGGLKDRLAEDGFLSVAFEPKVDCCTGERLIPLQAADLMAWESFNAIREMETRAVSSYEGLREPFRALFRHQWKWGVYDRKSLEDLQGSLDFNKRMHTLLKQYSCLRGKHSHP